MDNDKFSNINSQADAEAVVKADTSEIKNKYQSIKEVEELKKEVEKQKVILHAMWLLLSENGATNEMLDDKINDVIALRKHTDFKHVAVCPSCGKVMQKLENVPFTYKCYYCGAEKFGNPYRKYDDIIIDDKRYTPGSDDGSTSDIPADSNMTYEEAMDEKELSSAKEILSKTFEPYDVSNDLKFDDEDV